MALSRIASFVILALLLLGTSPAAQGQAQSQAQADPEASPAPSPATAPARAWPTTDELRRQLQEVDFVFRVDPATGDWLARPPATDTSAAAALTLDAPGAEPAVATLAIDLLQVDALEAEVSATLTALYEILPRLPLEPRSAERIRRFVIDDLITQVPQELEPCYLIERPTGAALVTIDAESGLATLRLGPSAGPLAEAEAAETDADLDLDACEPLVPEAQAEALEPTSERVTITIADGEEPAFDPTEVTLEGTLVTVILTLRNETDEEQTLTFEGAIDADTGPVAPGEQRLIVVRQLAAGDYPFVSGTDPDDLRGVLRIVEPSLDDIEG